MGLLHIAGSARGLNPHNIFMAMFSPSSAHVAPFCPHNGADSARQYACKYAGKLAPQKPETERIMDRVDVLAPSISTTPFLTRRLLRCMEGHMGARKGESTDPASARFPPCSVSRFLGAEVAREVVLSRRRRIRREGVSQMSYRGVVYDTQSPPQLSCGSGDQASYVHSDQLRAARRDENSEGPLSPTEKSTPTRCTTCRP